MASVSRLTPAAHITAAGTQAAEAGALNNHTPAPTITLLIPARRHLSPSVFLGWWRAQCQMPARVRDRFHEEPGTDSSSFPALRSARISIERFVLSPRG